MIVAGTWHKEVRQFDELFYQNNDLSHHLLTHKQALQSSKCIKYLLLNKIKSNNLVENKVTLSVMDSCCAPLQNVCTCPIALTIPTV